MLYGFENRAAGVIFTVKFLITMILAAALVQMDIVWGDKDVNIERAVRAVENAAGADLVVLPEMFATGFMAEDVSAAEAMDGRVVTAMRVAAAKTGRAVAGSVIIDPADGGLPANRFVFVRPDGGIEWYDKRHLFSFSGEDRYYTRGKRRRVIEYCGIRILPQVCYDLRFPVWSRNRNDYDAAIYVASWPESRVYAWDTLLRARAIENQCYVLGVNRVGNDPTAAYNGHSCAVDFYGRTIGGLADGAIGTIYAELDTEALASYRAKFRAWCDADDFDLSV